MLTMWRYIIFISIVNHLAVADVITSISGGYYNASSPCLSALIHFNTTNSKGSTFQLFILSPVTFETDDCISYGNTGVCYVPTKYALVDKYTHITRVVERLKNGAIMVSPNFPMLIKYVDLFGRFFNISILERSEGTEIHWNFRMKSSCVGLGFSVRYLRYEMCYAESHMKSYRCEPVKEIYVDMYSKLLMSSPIMNCIEKYVGYTTCSMVLYKKIRPNALYKFRMQYSTSYDKVYSQWSQYGYYPRKN